MTILNAGMRRATTNAVSVPASTSSWQRHGACRGEDPDLFFPTGGRAEVRKQSGEAQRVCFQCPVMQQCLNWALETGQDTGVWGGLSAEDRRRMRRGKTAVGMAYQEPNLEAVEAYLAGKKSDVSDGDRLAAIVSGVTDGMRYKDFDALHGLPRNATGAFVCRMRQTFEDRGLDFPLSNRRSTGRRAFTDEQVKEIRVRAARGVRETVLAAEFEVHRTTIESVVTGETYPKAGGPTRSVRPRRVSSVRQAVQSDMGVAA